MESVSLLERDDRGVKREKYQGIKDMPTECTDTMDIQLKLEISMGSSPAIAQKLWGNWREGVKGMVDRNGEEERSRRKKIKKGG